MLFIQKYYSLKDIEMEFLSSLENLLVHEIPNISWLIQQEELALKLKSSRPFYFLFFCEKHNEPVGLAQVNLYDLPKILFTSSSSKFFKRYFKKKVSWKVLSCKIHGPTNPGYIFHPHYQKEGIIELKKILHDLSQQYPIALEILNQDTDDHSAFQKNENVLSSLTMTLSIPHVLYKRYKDYHAYLKSLGEANAVRIKTLWQELENQSRIRVKEYPSLLKIAQAFPSLLRNDSIVNHNLYPLYQHTQGLFLAFEKQESILGLIILVEGQNGHLFCDIFCADHLQSSDETSGPLIDNILLGQYAIKVFFEMEAYKRLYFINPLHSTDFQNSPLQDIGLTIKRQLISVNPRTSMINPNWDLIKKSLLELSAVKH